MILTFTAYLYQTDKLINWSPIAEEGVKHNFNDNVHTQINKFDSFKKCPTFNMLHKC